MGIKEWIVPQDRIFFDLFKNLAAIVRSGADHMVETAIGQQDIHLKYVQMKEIEHTADDIAHSIFELLNRTFIPPFEPEEISRLTKSLDDIIDYLTDTMQHMHTYSINKPDIHMVEMAEIIQRSTKELEAAISDIIDIKRPQKILEHCIEVNRLENEVDDILERAITDLFKTDDPLRIIKFKDIYEDLERASDRCEDAAHVIADITIKHS